MTPPAQIDPAPLRPDGRGGFRVGSSRVPLAVVIHEHQQSASAEAIA
jgi:hypothetical protein